jgi:hypothetical protein
MINMASMHGYISKQKDSRISAIKYTAINLSYELKNFIFIPEAQLHISQEGQTVLTSEKLYLTLGGEIALGLAPFRVFKEGVLEEAQIQMLMKKIRRMEEPFITPISLSEETSMRIYGLAIQILSKSSDYPEIPDLERILAEFLAKKGIFNDPSTPVVVDISSSHV